MITSVIKILPKKGLLRGLIRDKGLEEEDDSVPPELAYFRWEAKNRKGQSLPFLPGLRNLLPSKKVC